MIKYTMPKFSDDKTKQKAIENEIKRLRDLLRDLPDDKLKVVTGLIEHCAITLSTLKELTAIIDKNGCVTKMPQGSYEIERVNPALTQYTQLLPKYSAVCKQLMDMLPNKSGGDTDDGFENFRAGKK